ncbi:SAV_2336 N-terminal domain-related protein [Nocardia sp. NPDC052112]|uniref:SAV_2336 N-terminal domain-related protein n=1 Tax=Nocardia sp. NPDC052112 TaxID=3155646 RepID=UPI00341F6C92
MIDRLITALQAADIDVDWRELADILWLFRATHTPATAPGNSTSRLEPGRRREPEPTSRLPAQVATSTPAKANEKPRYRLPSSPVHRTGTLGSSDVPLDIRARDPSARTWPLGIETALRPLRRRRRSRSRSEIDIDASIKYYCETSVLVPIQVPVSESWFNRAVLVVDGSPTMAVWRNAVATFERTLRRQRAIQTVDRLVIRADGTRVVAVSDVRAVTSAQLPSPNLRQLVIVVTDCVGPMWHRPKVWEELRGWGMHGPVVVVHMLPPRLWSRTALGDADVEIKSSSRGQANSRLKVTAPWWWTEMRSPSNPIPVTTLDPVRMHRWARMVMALDGTAVPGVLTDSLHGASADRPATAGPDTRVNTFRASVSTEANKLAVLLSAVEVTLPVAEIILNKLVGSGSRVHLAEVLIGGLLQQTGPDSYDFFPGVREILWRSLTTSATIDVWRTLSPYLETSTGRTPPFSRLLDGADVADYADPLTEIAARLVRRLGLDTRPYDSVAELREGMNRKAQSHRDERSSVLHFGEERTSDVLPGRNPARTDHVDEIDAVLERVDGDLARGSVPSWLRDAEELHRVSMAMRQSKNDFLGARRARRLVELLSVEIAESSDDEQYIRDLLDSLHLLVSQIVAVDPDSVPELVVPIIENLLAHGTGGPFVALLQRSIALVHSKRHEYDQAEQWLLDGWSYARNAVQRYPVDTENNIRAREAIWQVALQAAGLYSRILEFRLADPGHRRHEGLGDSTDADELRGLADLALRSGAFAYGELVDLELNGPLPAIKERQRAASDAWRVNTRSMHMRTMLLQATIDASESRASSDTVEAGLQALLDAVPDLYRETTRLALTQDQHNELARVAMHYAFLNGMRFMSPAHDAELPAALQAPLPPRPPDLYWPTLDVSAITAYLITNGHDAGILACISRRNVIDGLSRRSRGSAHKNGMSPFQRWLDASVAVDNLRRRITQGSVSWDASIRQSRIALRRSFESRTWR